MTTSSSFPRLPRPTPVRAATLALCLMLGGCSTIGGWFSDKSDYKAGSQRTQPLEVPPDLTQLQRDSRYLPQGGTVAASELGKPGVRAPEGTQTPTVALNSLGDLRVERAGTDRFIVTARSPEVLWPQVRQFWISHGYPIAEENATAGYIETEWTENKIQRPHTWIGDAIGRVIDNLHDSGMRDRFRTRLERTANGTEIFITHFGLQEEVTGWQKDGTKWVARPTDLGLEAEMMSQMMVSLGAGDAAARTAVANPVPSADAASASAGATPAVVANANARARLVSGQPGAALQVDDNFDRSWRRVGLALDHGGFTVEDRDRAQGLYFVRFVDAKEAAKDEPNFFSKIWYAFIPNHEKSPVGKYRIRIKADGDRSLVTLLDNQGQPSNDENAQRIAVLLVDELK